MRLWIDAQLSPGLAQWITTPFPDIEASAVRDFGLRDAEDIDAARQAHAVVMSKDSDFVEYLVGCCRPAASGRTIGRN